jgi:hypothetical protein
MSTRSTCVLSVLILSSALIAAGCGQTDEQVLAEQGYSVESENGGFSIGQQLPQLAVAEAELERGQTVVYAADDEALAAAEAGRPAGAPVFVVRLAWGQFPLNGELDQPTRWRGLVAGLGAKVFVQQVIFYERHDFFRPCRRHDCVAIDSRTLPHHDGLVLKVVPTAPGARLLIGIEGLYGRVLDLEQLAGLSDRAEVDGLGNQVLLDAFARPACAAGVLGGVWKRLDERGGVFAGDWLNEEGLVAGQLAGIWGQRRDGQQKLFGIYADRQGDFLGLIRGQYAELPGVGGVFSGHWIDGQGRRAGVLGGRFGPHPGGYPLTVFHGRFQAACGQQPPDQPPLQAQPGPDCLASGACHNDGQLLQACTCHDAPDGSLACSCQL